MHYHSRSDSTTLQQTILLAMVYCIEDWCQYIFWATLLCIVGLYDEGTYLKDRVKAMKKNALERRTKEHPHGNDVLSAGMKVNILQIFCQIVSLYF